MKKLLSSLLVISLTACVSTTQLPDQSTLGSSPDNAVVFDNVSSGFEGVRMEYAWIHENYPGSEVQGQLVVRQGSEVYDEIKVRMPDGSTRSIYFQITEWYGKF